MCLKLARNRWTRPRTIDACTNITTQNNDGQIEMFNISFYASRNMGMQDLRVSVD